MIQLLKFIVSYLSALFDEYGFQLKASENSGNRFSGASILMASRDLEIFLAIERDEITADFRSVFDKRERNWYSIDIILSFLGHRCLSGVLDDQNASLMRDGLPEIIDCFRESNVERTLKLLDGLEKERSKGM
ncbi:MAG: hypothetical protein U1D97_02470 [Desulfuromonadales bacterium]|nr:hypothetical protein [Desulfuromonadales bacterium]